MSNDPVIYKIDKKFKFEDIDKPNGRDILEAHTKITSADRSDICIPLRNEPFYRTLEFLIVTGNAMMSDREYLSPVGNQNQAQVTYSSPLPLDSDSRDLALANGPIDGPSSFRSKPKDPKKI